MFEFLRKKSKLEKESKMPEQKSSEAINIRNFLYLDVERMKSIFAQLEEGLVIGREHTEGATKEVSGKGRVGIPSILDVTAGGKFIRENEERETKIFHDYIHHHVESKMLKNNMVTAIDNSNLTLDELMSDELRSEMDKKPFLLINGKITLDDYEYMKGILENFNELSEFIERCSPTYKTLTEGEWNKIKKELLKNKILHDWEIKGYKMFFEKFYKERCMVTFYTNTDVPERSFTGHLIKAFIRDGLESVMFRYGTSPQIPWKVLAQIAYIPIKGESMHVSMIPEKARSFDEALRGFLGAFRGIEKMATGLSYPAISIIPIAIYR